jgi:hypothetical protein
MIPWGAAPRRPYHLVASGERADGGGILGLLVFVPEHSAEQALQCSLTLRNQSGSVRTNGGFRAGISNN